MKYCKLSGMIEAFNRVHDEAQLEELNYLEFINKLLAGVYDGHVTLCP